MQRNRYDETFTTEAVRLALSVELSYVEVALDLGIRFNQLDLYHDDRKPPSKLPKKGGKPTKSDYQALEHQNQA